MLSDIEEAEKKEEQNLTTRASTDQLMYICHTSFIKAIPKPRSLNLHYKPFSSEVYGETKLEQMQKIMDQIEFGKDDVFVDLGSGVGTIVLYVAGAREIRKSVGIEKEDVPAMYAGKFETCYKSEMKTHNACYSDFELLHGDFLSPEFKQLITEEATIVFINNFAFSPELEERIKSELIGGMREGARIVSTRPYATGTKRINARMLRDVESILDVSTLESISAPASWTDEKVPYYLHIVNRAKLFEYFENEHTRTRKIAKKIESCARSRPFTGSTKSIPKT